MQSQLAASHESISYQDCSFQPTESKRLNKPKSSKPKLVHNLFLFLLDHKYFLSKAVSFRLFLSDG